MMTEENLLERLGITFLVLILISILFEGGILLYGFLNADKVECNLLWCSFKTQNSVSSKECYINGEQVNCSKFNDIEDDWFCNDDNCSMNGIAPPSDFWMQHTQKR